MANQIYQRGKFKIYRVDDCYILHNTKMDGFAHTHLDSIRQAKLLIELSLKKKYPHDLSRYLLESLVRINDDEVYVQHIQELLDNKRKKQEYYNPGRKRSGGDHVNS